MNASTLEWLLAAPEPWTRYRTRVDLLDQPLSAPEVQSARAEVLAHPQVQQILNQAASWPGYTLQRHNDAKHPLHQLSILVDFGLLAADPGVEAVLQAILAHQSPDGALQTLVCIPRAFGGTGSDSWSWMACDAPVLLSFCLALGLKDHPAVNRALTHLTGLVQNNGWRCAASSDLGKFHGPGRRDDPCPLANLLALQALSYAPQAENKALCCGVETLFSLWEHRQEQRPYLFAMGSDFCKLKYPMLWYDLLHVLDVLSRFDFARSDPRYPKMLAALTAQANPAGQYTAGSMYQAWKGWSFADKKLPSPWLTLLALRIQKRSGCL